MLLKYLILFTFILSCNTNKSEDQNKKIEKRDYEDISKEKVAAQKKERKKFLVQLKRIDGRLETKILKNLMLNKENQNEFFEVINKLISETKIDFDSKKQFIEDFFYDGAIKNFIKNERIELIEFLFKKNLLELDKAYGGMPLLHEAVNSKKYQIVEKLIDLGADINKFYNGNTPLSYSILNLDYEGAKILLKKGANKNHLELAKEINKNNLNNTVAKKIIKLLE